MSLLLVRKEEQQSIKLDDGFIVENKLIGLPEENAKVLHYSNLFYLSHFQTERGGILNDHTHYSFEVFTLMLKGEGIVYDPKTKQKTNISEGHIQFIHAGNFVKHSEKLAPGTEYIELWLDPDINRTLTMPIPIENYTTEQFPAVIEQGRLIKVLAGHDSPLQPLTEGIVIKDMQLSYKIHRIPLQWNNILSVYVVDGEIEIEDLTIRKGDYFIIKNQEDVTIIANTDSRLLMIESPARPSYQTYAERFL
jgi:quercetin 2,3-dioxygenase